MMEWGILTIGFYLGIMFALFVFLDKREWWIFKVYIWYIKIFISN